MPTYEYHCDSCDRNFDVVQSFHDDALTACPTCGSPVRKVFGNVGIVFKGSGFYKTDSRSGTAKQSDGAAAPAAGAEEKGSDSGVKSVSDSNASSSGTDGNSTTPATTPTAPAATSKPSSDGGSGKAPKSDKAPA